MSFARPMQTMAAATCLAAGAGCAATGSDASVPPPPADGAAVRLDVTQELATDPGACVIEFVTEDRTWRLLVSPAPQRWQLLRVGTDGAAVPVTGADGG